jgi:hypothetical protein
MPIQRVARIAIVFTAIALPGCVISRSGTGASRTTSSDTPDAGDEGGTTAPLVLSSADGDRTISAVIGQDIELTLGTIGPGNYGDPELSSDSVRFDGMEYPATQNPGGPTQIFHFHTVATGTTTITIPHIQNPTPFIVTIDVSP